MDDFMSKALEIAKAQASVRVMSAEEILNYAKSLASGLQNVTEPVPADAQAFHGDPKKSIRESSVTCLVCGAKVKVLTSRHLEKHGLTPDAYRVKFGLKKGTPLSCKSRVKECQERMQKMRLWERKKKAS
ncbi:MAG: MucR family transcriptional regulator [Desulfovibrio sp.]|jgi:predicted transcriptional regulator|nr:MucR family transcriptional regulator [Desulfovibrio sp.]